MEQSVELILAICGGISIILGAIAAVWKFIRPLFQLTGKVNDHEKELEAIKQHEKNDLESIESLRRMSRAQCSAMVTLLNHMIEGNNTDRMKQTRKELLELLSDE